MDYCLYGDRCSVAKISNDYGGVLRLKVILGNILRNTKSVCALFKRPNYWEVEETHGLIASLVSSTENLKVADDFFSISFEYITGANNDEFIHVFSRLWYQFEQPTGYFFTSILNGESFNSILETKTLSLSEKHIRIFNLASCYMTFKSIEDDVMWIDKHPELSWEPILPRF